MYAHLCSAISMSTKKWLDCTEITDAKLQDADQLVKVLETGVLKQLTNSFLAKKSRKPTTPTNRQIADPIAVVDTSNMV